jgi:hypothetical protein
MAQTTVGIKDQAGTTQNMTTFVDVSGNQVPGTTADNALNTYRVSATFTPFATAAITVLGIAGSATKTVRVKRIVVGGVATALADTLFKLQRTSAVGSGGTAITPTVAKLDTSSAAASAVVTHYTTAAQSSGTVTGLGPLSTFRLWQETTAVPTVASRDPYIIFPERGTPTGQSIVLRGTADAIEVQNLNAGNLAAGTVLDYMIEWTEDAS